MPKEPERLSDLEHTTLGVIRRLGPITPYRVRKEFLESPSSVFSGSAGAIYPLLARLENRGLVASTKKTTGKRESRTYILTPAGRKRLIAWMQSPIGPDQATDYDPIRVRIHSMGALTPAKQLEFLRNAEHALSEQLTTIKAHCERHRRDGDLIDYHAARGGLHTMRARIKWIREIRDSICND